MALKYTEGDPAKGAKPEELRESFLVHQREARKGELIQTEYYRLISPNVYGEIGKFLVMEYMEGLPAEQAEKTLKGGELESFYRAYNEFKKNIRTLHEKGKFKQWRDPQPWDSIVLGNTRPEDPARGTWLFALPYDSF